MSGMEGGGREGGQGRRTKRTKRCAAARWIYDAAFPKRERERERELPDSMAMARFSWFLSSARTRTANLDGERAFIIVEERHLGENA